MTVMTNFGNLDKAAHCCVWLPQMKWCSRNHHHTRKMRACIRRRRPMHIYYWRQQHENPSKGLCVWWRKQEQVLMTDRTAIMLHQCSTLELLLRELWQKSEEDTRWNLFSELFLSPRSRSSHTCIHVNNLLQTRIKRSFSSKLRIKLGVFRVRVTKENQDDSLAASFTAAWIP